ncbi:hypothetical protein D9758_010376 [Tetrapyrgos nigripes]|uniref:Ubiquitin-like protease family profile domain-containing protein n=1 Tax=Tetrapyrgos nigripes TaxID=182062 RepID=A0A8H5FV20_9AGAR|nr:hypothetical protein D9758_010376 [Tetrapyrgos nigripes]
MPEPPPMQPTPDNSASKGLLIPDAIIRKLLPISDPGLITDQTTLCLALATMNSKNIPDDIDEHITWPPDNSIFSKEPSPIQSANQTLFLKSQCPMPTLIRVNKLYQCSTLALSQGHQTFLYNLPGVTGSPIPMKLPMWVLLYWLWVYQIREHHTAWKEGLVWLEHNRFVGHEVDVLDPLPWQLEFPCNLSSPLDLSRFLQDKWLNAENINQMLAVLDDELQQGFPIENIYWSNTLVEAYRRKDDNSYRCNRNLDLVRNQLRDGVRKRIVFPVFVCLRGFTETLLPAPNVKGNHWGAVAIDVDEKSFSYGDSSCGRVAPELLEAISWFLAEPFPEIVFIYNEHGLPAGLQNDSDSCSLYCVNTISHFLASERYPMYTTENPAVLRRIAFEKISKLILKQTNGLKQPGSSVPPTPNLVPKMPNQPMLRSKPLTSKPPPPKSDAQTLLAPIFTKTSKKRERNSETNAAKTTTEDWFSDTDDEDDGESIEGDLVVLLLPKPKATGAPKNQLLDQLLRLCHRPQTPNKIRHKCMAEKCQTSWSKCSLTRAVKHVSKCVFVSQDLKEKADEILLCKAPSTVVEWLQEGNQDSAKEPKQKKVKLVSDNLIMGNWMEEAKKLSREQ